MTNEMISAEAPFKPDWVSPPGDTILDILEEREWTQQQLADRLGYSAKHVNQLIKGKVALTEEAASRLSSVLGASVGFWLQREALFRERVALSDVAEQRAGMTDWLEKFPVKELMDSGAIPKCKLTKENKPALVGELLSFFGVASPTQWEQTYGCMSLSFRRSQPEQSDVGAISAWLRLGERKAECIDGPKYNSELLRDALAEIRSLTLLPADESICKLTRVLLDAGVVSAMVPAIPRARCSGVARWLNPSRPLIQLSAYGKSNDRFWFTVFHEIAHILLHANEKKAVFLDDPGRPHSNSREEMEADEWARNFLIPVAYENDLPHLTSKQSVIDFAAHVGVHPGIVVGRLQHDRLIAPDWMNGLKMRIADSDFAT